MASNTAQRATQKQGRYPVPLEGLNLNTSVMAMPVTSAYVLENFVIRTFGIEIRKGWRYYLGCPATTPDKLPHGVGTLMTYGAPVPASSKMFAATEAPAGAIFDVTTAGVTPVAPSLIPSSPPNVPGEWYNVMYLTPGGSFLCMVSAGAGYYVWNGTAWTEYTNGGGPLNISFPVGDTTTTKQFSNIFVWKNRLWFIKANSSTAYYLPTNQISGSLQPFVFGAMMPRGGNLEIGINWTYDGGAGIDDFLIMLGSGGDMLIYQGTDPAGFSTFSLKGIWHIGRIPAGRRAWALAGGDVLIITEYGIHSVSDLVSGRITDASASSQYGSKINPTVSRQVSASINSKYWFLAAYAKEEMIIMGSPYINPDTGALRSYVMSTLSKGWSTVINMPMVCATVFAGELFYGTKEGYIVQALVGSYDGTTVNGNLVGSEVTARLQGAFIDYGSPSKNKRLTRLKLLGLANGIPSYLMKIVSEYDLNSNLSPPASVVQLGSLWDSSLWDVGLWSQASSTFGGWYGVAGFGKKLSTLLAIRGQGGTLITDIEATYQEGNGL